MVYLLADSVARINAALKIRSKSVPVRYSKLVLAFVRLLYVKGVIRGFSIMHQHNVAVERLRKNGRKVKMYIMIFLKYDHGSDSILSKLCTVSRPGHRVYGSVSHLAKCNFSRAKDGFFIVSTGKGLLSSYDLIVSGLYNEVLSGEILLLVVF